MEFSDVGAHCHFDLCGQQTFLPFKCESCKHRFCKHHRSQKSHQCPHLKKEETEAKEIEKKKILTNKKNEINKPIYKCNYKKCKKREWVNFECNKCNESFCLKHRSPDAHKCGGHQDKKSKLRKQREAFITNLLSNQNNKSCGKEINGNHNKTKYEQSIMVQ